MTNHIDFGPRPEPEWNTEVKRHHAGEDGWGWLVTTTREMFIDEQAWAALMENPDFHCDPFIWEMAGDQS